MLQLKMHHMIVLGVCSLLLLAWIAGCPRSSPTPAPPARPTPPGLNPQLLHGVWRATEEGIDIAWTFAPDGAFRWQIQPRNPWWALVGAGFDVQGRWKLTDDQLTMELLETPPALALWGENWTGQAGTVRIKKLTAAELEFHDSEFRFRKSLAPPEP